jgi:hypothetical protein
MFRYTLCLDTWHIHVLNNLYKIKAHVQRLQWSSAGGLFCQNSQETRKTRRGFAAPLVD